VAVSSEFAAPPPPPGCLTIGITGHRARHPAWRRNAARIAQAIAAVFDQVETARLAADGPAPEPRLVSLLADGTDRVAAGLALECGYRLIVPLPFSTSLNAAIIDSGGYLAERVTSDPELDHLLARAGVFALADRDRHIEALLEGHRAEPGDARLGALLDAEVSRRVALAGRIMIEQSDFLVAVWDGDTTALGGGTGDTVAAALTAGCPVVRIDPARPEVIEVMHAIEMLTRPGPPEPRPDALEALLAQTIASASGRAVGAAALGRERWRARSGPLVHAYRRVEALFGTPRARDRLRGLTQHYETPAAIAGGSAAPMLAALHRLPGVDPALALRIERNVLPRFAWADGISTFLSDAYRSGMTVNFVLSSLAVVGGLAYLPFVPVERKWVFALFELALLAAIIAITWLGRRQRWHGRWFETRRVAEYLRVAPVMLAFGAARARGGWPRGTDTDWPETYARQAVGEVGLPAMTVTTEYLRAALDTLLLPFVRAQQSYHEAKAERLAAVHHRLDHLSETLFKLAVGVVAIYLLLQLGVTTGVIEDGWLGKAAKWFTVLGAALPTFGAAIAGIRYFGDFERFAAISRVTAAKLAAIRERIELLLERAGDDLSYERAAALVHAAEDVVFSEIESWQGVFGGKRISVPV
jgi:hypothetical protein